MEAADMGGDLEKILLTAEQIDARLAQLAAQIDEDYRGRDLLLVGVLRGAVMTMADLSRKIRIPLEMDWMAVSSYGSGTKSSGVVRILKDLDTDIQGRNVHHRLGAHPFLAEIQLALQGARIGAHSDHAAQAGGCQGRDRRRLRRF